MTILMKDYSIGCELINFFSDKLFMEGGEILSDKHGLSFV